MTPIINNGMLMRPNLVRADSAWIGHIPFAGWIISALKPTIFVELGTHTGVSYSAFCQAVTENHLPTKCYAVDTWKGDEHASFYGEEVFEEYAAYHRQHFSSFSQLMRMTFDDAIQSFSDGSIDLLHIDGLHTYEAVKHDFETWLPKMSTKGVILFHDTDVRERNFGVWRLWEELSQRYSAFDFKHSYGLGVLFVGNKIPRKVTDFFSADPTLVRSIFSHLAEFISLQSRVRLLETDIVDCNSRLVASHDFTDHLRMMLRQRDDDLVSAQAHIKQLTDEMTLTRAERDTFMRDFNVIVNSITWKLFKPVRALLGRQYWARRFLRRTVKLIWRTMTLNRVT